MAYVSVDPAKPPGILISHRAAVVLNFLEQCAGASEAALTLIFPDVAGSLRILRGTGYVRRCFLPGQEALWVPTTSPVPTVETYLGRLALGWLAVRAKEAGCQVKAGRIRFLNGQVYRLAWWPGEIPEGPAVVVSVNGKVEQKGGGQLWTTLKKLKTENLKSALM